jgi:hypothetical protein
VGDVLVAHKKDDLLDSRLHSGCRVRIRNSDAGVRRNPGNSSRFSYFLVGHTSLLCVTVSIALALVLMKKLLPQTSFFLAPKKDKSGNPAFEE